MLKELADENNCGLIMLTETHLNDQIIDAEIQMHDFEIIRADRSDYKNGGVAIYVRSSLNLGVRKLGTISHNKIEVLLIELLKIKAIIVCAYKPPDTNIENFMIKKNNVITSNNVNF